jgi:hypothetical protein
LGEQGLGRVQTGPGLLGERPLGRTRTRPRPDRPWPPRRVPGRAARRRAGRGRPPGSPERPSGRVPGWPGARPPRGSGGTRRTRRRRHRPATTGRRPPASAARRPRGRRANCPRGRRPQRRAAPSGSPLPALARGRPPVGDRPASCLVVNPRTSAASRRPPSGRVPVLHLPCAVDRPDADERDGFAVPDPTGNCPAAHAAVAEESGACVRCCGDGTGRTSR